MLSIFNYVLMGILLVCAVFLVIAVLLQKTKEDGLSGAITGGADTFYGKDSANHGDVVLKRWTKIVGVIFAICVLVVYVIQPDYAQTESVGSWKELTDYANIFR
jgi:preprotein translocase subunit SecG